MDDLIKRQALIEFYEPYADRGLKIPVETVIQNIKDFDCSGSIQNWIFCKDKLPDKYSRYLVVYPLSSINVKPYIIDILDYGIVYPDQSKPFFYAFDSEFGDVEYDDVIAWMPLPELWEGADDE